MRFVHAVAFVLLGLGGCTTQAQNEAARMKAAFAEGQPEINACADKVQTMQSYLALKNKLPPLSSNAMASMELLTNSSKPTSEESAMLVELHRDGLLPCRQLAVARMNRVNPALATPMTVFYAKNDASYARLVKREITWGEHATTVNQDKTVYNAEYQQAFAKMNGDLNRSHNEESQRNADAMRRAAAGIDASRPRTTYCTGVAPYITCTTY